MSELETLDTATNADTSEPEGQTPAPEPRWFDPYLPEDTAERTAHEKIFGKYKDAAEALSSIPHREKLVGTRVDFPDPALPPEEAEKVHRKILGKLGASKKAEEYKVDEILKGLDDSVRAAIPPGAIEEVQRRAAELGLLPWQFERQLAMDLAAHEARVRATQDARDAAEREMKRIFGHKLTEKMGVAEQGADLIDADLFADELAAMGEGERSEKGGPLKQLLRDANSPVLYRLMAFVHDRVFAEGEPAPKGNTVKAQDEWKTAYGRSKKMNPMRPEEYHRRYADEVTGRGRGG